MQYVQLTLISVEATDVFLTTQNYQMKKNKSCQ